MGGGGRAGAARRGRVSIFHALCATGPARLVPAGGFGAAVAAIENMSRTFQRRRLLLWACGALTTVGLGAAVVVLIVLPAVELAAAERALSRYDVADARARLDRYLTRRPNDGPALLLA